MIKQTSSDCIFSGSKDAGQEEKKEIMRVTPRLMRINIMESITGGHQEIKIKVLFTILDQCKQSLDPMGAKLGDPL